MIHVVAELVADVPPWNTYFLEITGNIV